MISPSLDNSSRLSQAIKDAAETANKKQVQKASTLGVNSIGIQSTPKCTERTTAFSEATDSLGEQIKAARDRKAAEVKPEAKGIEQPEAKSLADLLRESAQERE